MTESILCLLLGEQCRGLAGRKVVPVFVSGDWALNDVLHSSSPFALPKHIIFSFLLFSTEQNLTAWDITLSGSFWGCSHDHEIPFIKWVNIRSYHFGSEKILALKRFMPENMWFGLPYAVLSDKDKCRAVAKRRKAKSKNNAAKLFSFSAPLRSCLNI